MKIRDLGEKVDVKRSAAYSIIINAVQIAELL